MVFPLSNNHIELQPMTSKFATALYCDWLNNPVINDFLESRFTEHTIDSVLEFIETITGDNRYYFFAIVDCRSQEHIGNIKLGPIDNYHKLGEIGLLIGNQNYWGKNIATESISLIRDFAFSSLNLHKLTAGMYANNIGSYKAFLKSGFLDEGLAKNHFIHNTTFVDKIIMGIENPNFTL